MEFLPAIPPGLGARAFMERLQRDIEGASDRLMLEAANARPHPPLPAETAARLAELRAR